MAGWRRRFRRSEPTGGESGPMSIEAVNLHVPYRSISAQQSRRLLLQEGGAHEGVCRGHLGNSKMRPAEQRNGRMFVVSSPPAAADYSQAQRASRWRAAHGACTTRDVRLAPSLSALPRAPSEQRVQGAEQSKMLDCNQNSHTRHDRGRHGSMRPADEQDGSVTCDERDEYRCACEQAAMSVH
jgi:hypothetical protein